MNTKVNALSEKIHALSAAQIEEVTEFVDSLRLRGLERELTGAAAAASARVFEEIWNNAEDDVYDAL